MEFDDRDFARHRFTAAQVRNNLSNAKKDLLIAHQARILEVRFQFSYSALIKSGIALLSSMSIRPRSTAGHHMKIIYKLAESLEDDEIEVTGNIMRTKRNQDFYGGGIFITEKEAAEFLQFTESVMRQVEKAILASAND